MNVLNLWELCTILKAEKLPMRHGRGLGVRYTGVGDPVNGVNY